MKQSGSFLMKFVAIGAVTIIGLTVLFGWYAWRIFRQETLNRYMSETSLFAGAATEAIKSNDDMSALTVLQNLRRSSQLEYARVIDENNVVRISLNPAENGRIEGPDSGISGGVQGADSGGPRYRFVAPDAERPAGVHEYSDVLINPLSGRECGRVRVGFSGVVMRAGGRRIATHAAIAGAISLALGGLLAGLVVRMAKK